jgi:phage-related protein
MTVPPKRKPVRFVGNAQSDLRRFPKKVRLVVGTALNTAQLGGKHKDAKPMKGFGGASVVEIVDDFDGATFRAVYTVRFADVVYVLHAFQKKSKKGIETPKNEIDLIKQRLKLAEQDYKSVEN